MTGIETRAVMLGRPKTPCRLAASATAALLWPICAARAGVRDLRAAQHRSGAVDQQRAQVEIAALGGAAESSPGNPRLFAWREAQCAGEISAGGKELKIHG